MYWQPQFKWQLVDWLKNRYPNDNWRSKRKGQLRAIYNSIRKKEG